MRQTPVLAVRTMARLVIRRGSRGWGALGRRPPLGRKDPRRRRGFPLLKGRKKGHWCLLNGCSTPFRHNMAINILKSCKSVFAYVKNRSFPSHIRSSFPWRPPLEEILDPRLVIGRYVICMYGSYICVGIYIHTYIGTYIWATAWNYIAKTKRPKFEEKHIIGIFGYVYGSLCW